MAHSQYSSIASLRVTAISARFFAFFLPRDDNDLLHEMVAFNHLHLRWRFETCGADGIERDAHWQAGPDHWTEDVPLPEVDHHIGGSRRPLVQIRDEQLDNIERVIVGHELLTSWGEMHHAPTAVERHLVWLVHEHLASLDRGR